jgi:hypothetical protein
VGLPLPTIQLFASASQEVRIPFAFALLVLVLFAVGWTYMLAAAQAAAAPLRWAFLVCFSVALAAAVVAGTGATRAEAQSYYVPPLIIALAIVWAVALIVGRRASPRLLPAVAGMLIAIGVLFGLYQAESQLLASGEPALPAEYGSVLTLAAFLAWLNITQYPLFPLYTFVGFDLSEVVLGGARNLVSDAHKLLRDRSAIVAGAAIGMLAIVSEGIFKPQVFQTPFLLAYTSVWSVASVAFLARFRPPGLRREPGFAMVFWVVVASWLIFLPLSLADVAASVYLSQAILGAVVLGIASWRLRPPRRDHAGVFLGLVGIWLLFLNLPQVLIATPAVPNDFLGATDPVALSGIGLVLVSLAAVRRGALIALASTLSIWTLALVFMRWFVAAVLASDRVGELLAALQLMLLIVLLALAARMVPLRLRLLGSALALVGLAGSIVFSFLDRSTAIAAVAQSVLLAVGVLWHTLMSGERVTNREGALWPRTSRVIGYLGYTLVALSVGLFFSTASGIESFATPLGAFPATGLRMLGVPTLLYVLGADWLAGRKPAPVGAGAQALATPE